MTYYQITDSMKKIFANPKNLEGILFEGNPEFSIPKAIDWMKKVDNSVFTAKIKSPERKKYRIICVGDIISEAMFNYPNLKGIIKYLFIDGETKREKIASKLNIIPYKSKTFKNPAGRINLDIFQFIKDTISDNDQYLVNIEGEEDLIVLPAVIESNNYFIFYGQPPITDVIDSIPSGCVGIYSSTEVKRKYRILLDQLHLI